MFTSYGYEDFCELSLQEVKKQYPDADFMDVRKPGVLPYRGLSVPLVHISETEGTGVVINMSDMYDLYGRKGADYTIAEIFAAIDRGFYDIDRVKLQKFHSWEMAKDSVMERLLPQKGNEFLPDQSPVSTYLDMYICYELRFDGATALISNQMMGAWGVSKEDLIGTAEVNRKKEKFEVMDLYQEILLPMLPADESRDVQEYSMHMTNPMIVITNAQKLHGAAALLSKDVLDKAAAMVGLDNIMILPSSQHELIAIRGDLMSAEEAREMVKGVNETQVEPKDRLTDSVYTYNTKTKEISLAGRDHRMSKKMSL